jgi:3-hydroxyacyl-CoA dehydrogenase
MSQFVTVTRDANVGIVTLDNPPVNSMSLHLRKPLADALAQLNGDNSVAAIVLACAGRTFVAGADITEFGTEKALASPNLVELIAQLEAIDKPTIAAIHGTALGGGLELALGCQYRVADAKAKLGLPEVKLGLLPGAGGTIRLPRLVGPSKALKMVVTGVPISAKDALASGLVDDVFESDLVANAVTFAKDAVQRDLAAPVSQRNEKIQNVDLAAFDKEVADILKKSKGLDAPKACAQSVRNAITMPFDQAVAAERKFFLALVTGDQSRAQRHLFFAEREAAKAPGVAKDDKPRKISRVGVIGAGTMGGGISMSFVNGGIPVTLLEMNEEALKRGMGVIDKNYGISVSRGSLTEEAKAKRLSMYTTTTNYEDLADCDLIIEAVFEEIGVKEQVFSTLDRIAKPGAILASNTSYLDVNKIASFTKRPQDVVGMHFFSPANVMKLLEIVRGDKTAPDVLATAIAVGKQIGKVPVVVGVCHGFVGNRMLGARGAEAEGLLLEGALPQQVDKVFTDFGWPMGTYQMWDLAGLDIGWRTRKSLGLKAAISDALCEMGRYGQKTGKGYYLYPDGRTATPDPEVEALILAEARKQGVNRRDISDEEIKERTVYPMINEGARILEEGIATRSSDIDIVWVNGYGYPVGQGGPMFWAELEGLPKIVDRLEYWYGKTGNEVYNPSPLLKRLAAEKKGFAEAKKTAA